MRSLLHSIIDNQIEKVSTKVPAPLIPFYMIITGQTARSGYWAAIDQGFISISNFIAAVFLARNVDPTQFGIYAVGFLLLHLIRAIQDGLIVQPMNAFGSIMPFPEFKEYVSSSGLLQGILAINNAIIAAVGGIILTKLGNDTAGPTLFALWLPFLGWQMQEFIRRLFYVRRMVKHAMLNTFVTNAIRLGILFYWGKIGLLSGKAGLIAIAWGASAGFIFGIIQTRKYWTLNFYPLRKTIRKNWGYGRWILGSSTANWVAAEVYPLLAAGLISFAAAGAYRALQNLVAPIHVLLRAIDTFITPRAAQIYQTNGRRGTWRLMRIVYLVAGIPIIGLLILTCLYPTTLLRLLYNETYVDYSNGMILMAIFYGLWFLYWPLQAIFKAIQITKPIFFANLVAIFSMFTIGIISIKQWGVYGAIGGQALNALIVSVILWRIWFSNNHSTTS
ncbi:MAG TPA: oligosaccharide flippase family protein [Anaerolineae bacterium]|nr:oligosaccharide flippase family protein [Anaerolineae bacterium]